MTKRTASTALMIVVVVSGFASLKAAKVTTVPVTTMIADSRNGFSLRVGSDTQGAYLTTYIRKQEAVTSAIRRYMDGTDWMLTTYYGVAATPSDRTVFFDLTEPVSTTNPIPPFVTGYRQAHLIARCHLMGVDLHRLVPGGSVDCPGSFRFQAQDGSWYRFSFQPDNFPQVNRLRMTCLSADGTGCKVWTVTPSTTRTTGSDPNPKSLNKLLLIDPFDDSIIADFGDYYLSFNITVAR